MGLRRRWRRCGRCDRVADLESELRAELMRYQHDPAGFVPACWLGIEPREWQADALADIGTRLRAGMEPGAAMMPVLKAIASGHGIGKSALLSWVIWWALSTCPHTKVVLTANTQDQLRTKTWPEVAKWAGRAVNRHWFSVQGQTIVSTDPAAAKTWRCDAVTWSETNLAAFAGLHNEGRRLLMVFDEASGIHDKVWEVAEGALTDADTEIVWLAMGNPTEPSGRFAECFGRQRHRWAGRQIDSRTVPGTNKQLFAQWVELYGEDSDFVRVRVRGVFPRAGAMQFIGADVVEAAAKRDAHAMRTDPLILGVDVARFGDDASVIAFRKGRDARTIPWITLRGVDTMTLAARVAEERSRHRADAVFVDGGGIGGGVVDRLRQLGESVIEVQFGGAADRVSLAEEAISSANKRAEMWGNMRTWLAHGAIPAGPELLADLTGPQYSFVVRAGRDAILLEPKEAMKRRGLASPDAADALALTFAYPAAPRPDAGLADAAMLEQMRGVRGDYDPFESMRVR